MPPQAQAIALALLFVVTVGLLYRFVAWLGRKPAPPYAVAEVATSDPPRQASAATAPAHSEPSHGVATAPTPTPVPRVAPTAASPVSPMPTSAAANPVPASVHGPAPRTAEAASVADTLHPRPPATTALSPRVQSTLPPAAPLVATETPTHNAPTPNPPQNKAAKTARSPTSARPKIAGASALAANRRPVRVTKSDANRRSGRRSDRKLPVLRARADKARLKIIGRDARTERRIALGLKHRLADRSMRIVGAAHTPRTAAAAKAAG